MQVATLPPLLVSFQLHSEHAPQHNAHHCQSCIAQVTLPARVGNHRNDMDLLYGYKQVCRSELGVLRKGVTQQLLMDACRRYDFNVLH